MMTETSNKPSRTCGQEAELPLRTIQHYEEKNHVRAYSVALNNANMTRRLPRVMGKRYFQRHSHST